MYYNMYYNVYVASYTCTKGPYMYYNMYYNVYVASYTCMKGPYMYYNMYYNVDVASYTCAKRKKTQKNICFSIIRAVLRRGSESGKSNIDSLHSGLGEKKTHNQQVLWEKITATRKEMQGPRKDHPIGRSKVRAHMCMLMHADACIRMHK